MERLNLEADLSVIEVDQTNLLIRDISRPSLSRLTEHLLKLDERRRGEGKSLPKNSSEALYMKMTILSVFCLFWILKILLIESLLTNTPVFMTVFSGL